MTPPAGAMPPARDDALRSRPALAAGAAQAWSRQSYAACARSHPLAAAPCNGRITALQVAAGEFANAGHPLFTIIDTEHWYAIGNFRESDLAGIKPGQRATVFVMARPSLPLRGTVDSLGWGVASDVSATFGGLPHVEKTLNWVRIAARFPVRVMLDEPPEDLLRLGASAVIEIKK
jgi:multidrug efflux system membrane fusion protein